MTTAIDPDRLQTAIEQQFECHRCGNCCKGEGLVHVGPAEVQAMANELGIDRGEFIKTYTIQCSPRVWILRDRLVEPYPGGPPELWCIFLERGDDGLYGCRVNRAKPRQCGTFPAQWRNPDSLRTCVGLRVLVQQLRRSAEAGTDAPVTDRD